MDEELPDISFRDLVRSSLGPSLHPMAVVDMLTSQAAEIFRFAQSKLVERGGVPAMMTPIIFGGVTESMDDPTKKVPLTFIGLTIDAELLASFIGVEGIDEQINKNREELGLNTSDGIVQIVRSEDE